MVGVPSVFAFAPLKRKQKRNIFRWRHANVKGYSIEQIEGFRQSYSKEWLFHSQTKEFRLDVLPFRSLQIAATCEYQKIKKKVISITIRFAFLSARLPTSFALRLTTKRYPRKSSNLRRHSFSFVGIAQRNDPPSCLQYIVQKSRGILYRRTVFSPEEPSIFPP